MDRRCMTLAMLLLGAACRDEGSSASTSDGSGSSTTETPSTSSSDTAADSSSGEALPCEALFGRPTAATGLAADACRPECPCLDGWVAPEYTDADLEALRARALIDPPAELDADPYETPDAFEEQPDSVCGVLLDGADAYRLQTYEGVSAAEAAGAQVTHFGACGLCSPLSDLAVYIDHVDLTEPVRACGVLGLTQGDDANLQCLLDLGFTPPCAQIWLYNTINTRTACLDECLDALDAPYHLPDGSLNPCLTCDEEQSGPVFKAVAGRTRRNTGLASALCRPCATVHPLTHVYG